MLEDHLKDRDRELMVVVLLRLTAPIDRGALSCPFVVRQHETGATRPQAVHVGIPALSGRASSVVVPADEAVMEQATEQIARMLLPPPIRRAVCVRDQIRREIAI